MGEKKEKRKRKRRGETQECKRERCIMGVKYPCIITLRTVKNYKRHLRGMEEAGSKGSVFIQVLNHMGKLDIMSILVRKGTIVLIVILSFRNVTMVTK